MQSAAIYRHSYTIYLNLKFFFFCVRDTLNCKIHIYILMCLRMSTIHQLRYINYQFPIIEGWLFSSCVNTKQNESTN